jgi:hypothetical protein
MDGKLPELERGGKYLVTVAPGADVPVTFVGLVGIEELIAARRAGMTVHPLDYLVTTEVPVSIIADSGQVEYPGGSYAVIPAENLTWKSRPTDYILPTETLILYT